MAFRVLWAIIVALVLVPSGARADTLRARLTDDVAPSAYDLTLAPDVGAKKIAGSETVDVVVRRPVDAIALNARHITVSRAVVDGRPVKVEVLPKIEQLRLRVGAPLRPGSHRVELTFDAVLGYDKGPGGLSDNADSPDVVSMFEPSTARTAFPCFDEPQFRARFTLHVRAPSDWTVVSNMPLHAKRALGPALAQSDFEPTPPMPVYLLTIDGGVYAQVEGGAGQVPIRVLVRPGQEEHGRAMLADAQRLLPFYESFFGVPFPLPKLDLVVSAGSLESALEGWGAITFYSEAGPFGTQFGGGARGRRIAVELLAHEMAHQWAGDLVTMRWWRDTFVAEGVAQFSQRQAVRAVFPELTSWLDDDSQVAALLRIPVSPDGLPALNDIPTDLDDDDSRVFQAATYDKGAAAIEGWRGAVGAPAFHDRLRAYLQRFAGGSATFEDFWAALGGAEGVAYGRSWLAQRGFPVVDVRSSCADGQRTIVVRQTPFVSDPAIGAAYRAQRWMVPLTIRAGAEERHVMLQGRTMAVRLATCAEAAIDPDARPYYLVRYDAAAYARLAERMPMSSDRDRGQLYRDASILYDAGELSDGPLLDLLAVAPAALDDDAWSALARNYGTLNARIRGSAESARLYALERRSLLPIVQRATTGAGESSRQTGYAAVRALSQIGDPAIGRAFAADVGAWLTGATAGNSMASRTVPFLAAAAATSADVERVESLKSVPPDHVPPFGSVGRTYLENVGDERLARRVLADVMRAPESPRNPRFSFLLALGRHHPELAYAYLRAHLRELRKTLPPTQQAWTIAMGAADDLWPAAAPAELERFLRAAFPADPAVVRRATLIAARHWAERRALEQALRALPASAPLGAGSS